MTNGTDNQGCKALPSLGDDLGVTLPFGGELKAFRDFSKGIPDDCSLTFNVLLQLPPLLGSLHCLFKILDVLAKLGEFVTAVPDLITNPTKVVDTALEVTKAIGALTPCLPIPAGAIPNIIQMICDVLKVVIKLLRCMVEALDSVVNTKANIDLATAEGNPALLDVLKCADDNANLTAAHVLAALKPVTPLLELIKPLGSIAQIDLELPSLDDISPDSDLGETTGKLREIVTSLEQVIESICP